MYGLVLLAILVIRQIQEFSTMPFLLRTILACTVDDINPSFP